MVVHGPPLTGSLERDTWQRSWQTAGRWGGEEGKNKTETTRVSCIFQKICKALPAPRAAPVTPSRPAVSGAARGTLPTTQRWQWQNFFFPVKVIPPLLPLSPNLFVATAAAWLHSQTALGVSGEQVLLSLLYTPVPLPRHSGSFVGVAGALPRSSFAQDKTLGKAPGLAPEILQGHHFWVNVSGGSRFLRNITKEPDANALELIQFQALNKNF